MVVLVAAVAYVVWESIKNSGDQSKTENQILVPTLNGPEGVVARVGKVDILLKDYADMVAKERIRVMSEENKDINEPNNSELAKTVRNSILNNLIEMAVYKNYAIEKGLEPTDAQLAKAVNEYVDSQANEVGGYDKLEKKLKENGYKSVDDYKNKLRENNEFRNSQTTLAVKKYLEKNVKITEKETKDFYESKLIGISRIVVFYNDKERNDATTKEGYETMNKLRELIDTKGTFSDIAKEFSEEYETAQYGGKVSDLYIKGSLPESVEKVVWNLKVGEVSEPILTSDSFWIVKVDMETYVWQYYFADTVTNKKVPFEQIKNKVGEQLVTIKVLEEENKWYSQYASKLKTEIFIDYKEVTAPEKDKSEDTENKSDKSK